MKVKFLKDSYYVASEKQNLIYKFTQLPKQLSVTVEVIDSMPEEGDYVAPGDVTILAIYDNLSQLAKQLEAEGLANPF